MGTCFLSERVLKLGSLVGLVLALVFAAQRCAYADQNPWSYVLVTTSGNTVIMGRPGVYMGIKNVSTSAQPAGVCTLFDNPSTNSGNSLYTETTIAAGQIILEPTPGTKVTGLTMNCAVPPSGSGILVYFQ